MASSEGWQAELLQLVDDCEQRESRLSDWDRKFLDSIRRQIEEGRTLTFKQQAKLDEIWDRATSRG